jgi:hypothetical protein
VSTVSIIAMGVLLYTNIVSPGYFAQKDQWIRVCIFGSLLLMVLLAILAV